MNTLPEMPALRVFRCVVPTPQIHRRWISTIAILAALAVGGQAQQRPLVTEKAETVGAGTVLFELGLEFLQKAKFPFSGLEGDLSRVGVFGLRVGAGEQVEIQVLGVVQNVLNVDSQIPAPNSSNLSFSGSSTNEVGDVTLATKVRLLEDSQSRPTVSFRFGMELPNASNESGLGNDETNAFGALLFEKDLGRIRALANVGVAILGDPLGSAGQNDLFTYGFAVLVPIGNRWSVVLDAYGRLGPGGIGTEEQSLLRVGAQIESSGLTWDVAAQFGLRDSDPDTGLIFGISKGFGF